MLAIKEVVMIRLIFGGKDSPAQFRNHAESDELGLEVNRAIGPGFPNIRQLVEQRVGLDGSSGPLIGATAVEDGILVGFTDTVGWNN